MPPGVGARTLAGPRSKVARITECSRYNASHELGGPPALPALSPATRLCPKAVVISRRGVRPPTSSISPPTLCHVLIPSRKFRPVAEHNCYPIQLRTNSVVLASATHNLDQIELARRAQTRPSLALLWRIAAMRLWHSKWSIQVWQICKVVAPITRPIPLDTSTTRYADQG